MIQLFLRKFENNFINLEFPEDNKKNIETLTLTLQNLKVNHISFAPGLGSKIINLPA